MKRKLKDVSKGDLTLNHEGNLSMEMLQTSALLRIADASEVMARNYQNLLSERDRYYKWYQEEQAAKEKLQRSVSALKGVITRLKNK